MSLATGDPRLLFKFQRQQFSIIVSYAITIVKSQGWSIFGIYICFLKGLLSVMIIIVYLFLELILNNKDDYVDCTSTTNVHIVYKEVC